MTNTTPPMLAQFLKDVTAYKQALWSAKVALWRTRKYERTSWRTLFTSMGISEKTARNYYDEVEAAMSGQGQGAPEYMVVDLNVLPEKLRQELTDELHW